MIRDDVGVMPRALADRYFSAVVEVTEPAACNRTRADYNLSVCAPIPRPGKRAGSLLATPNDVFNECYLGHWLREGGVAWDAYAQPLLGFDSPCLVGDDRVDDNVPWYDAQNTSLQATGSKLSQRWCPRGCDWCCATGHSHA